MNRFWKIGLAVAAVLILAVGAVGFVSAQTDHEVLGSDFVARLAEKLGITQEELQTAIDETQLDMVDDAVADDKLTEDQAERIRDRIESGEGLFPFGGFGRGFALGRSIGYLSARLDDVADFLGMDTSDLRDAVADGQSLAQIAEEQGKSADDLKAFLLSQVEERLAEAVENGRITQERADEILENAPDRIDDLISQEGGIGPWGGGHGHRGGGFGGPCDPESESDGAEGTSF